MLDSAAISQEEEVTTVEPQEATLAAVIVKTASNGTSNDQKVDESQDQEAANDNVLQSAPVTETVIQSKNDSSADVTVDQVPTVDQTPLEEMSSPSEVTSSAEQLENKLEEPATEAEAISTAEEVVNATE